LLKWGKSGTAYFCKANNRALWSASELADQSASGKYLHFLRRGFFALIPIALVPLFFPAFAFFSTRSFHAVRNAPSSTSSLANMRHSLPGGGCHELALWYITEIRPPSGKKVSQEKKTGERKLVLCRKMTILKM
jgi:hypothetical protein